LSLKNYLNVPIHFFTKEKNFSKGIIKEWFTLTEFYQLYAAMYHSDKIAMATDKP
jgi:hypothetical protein